MYFDNLTQDEKAFVQKNMFKDNKDEYAAFSSHTDANGVLEVGVMDFVTHTYKETYLTYKFNDFELLDICDENGYSLGYMDTLLNNGKKLNVSVFNYNLAMGYVNKEYQQKALEYFKTKMQDGNLPIDVNIMYEVYHDKLQTAYESLNRKEAKKQLQVQNKKSLFNKIFKKNEAKAKPKLSEEDLVV